MRGSEATIVGRIWNRGAYQQIEGAVCWHFCLLTGDDGTHQYLASKYWEFWTLLVKHRFNFFVDFWILMRLRTKQSASNCRNFHSRWKSKELVMSFSISSAFVVTCSVDCHPCWVCFSMYFVGFCWTFDIWRRTAYVWLVPVAQGNTYSRLRLALRGWSYTTPRRSHIFSCKPISYRQAQVVIRVPS